MALPVGNPMWQMVILWISGLFVLWEIWRGWRAGVARSGLQVAAILVSSALFLVVARIAAVPFGGLDQFSGLIVGGAIGLGVGLVSLFVIWLLGALLFKRTSQQNGAALRFFWGLGGAFFGVIIAVIILWGAVSIIRGVGAVAEGRLQLAPTADSSGPVAARHPSSPPPPSSPGFSEKALQTFVIAKQSLELGSVGQFVKNTDPVPPDAYQIFNGMGRLTGDPAVLTRLTQYPGIQKLMQSPPLQRLANDPSIIAAVQDGNYAALFSNKAILAAVRDPAMQAELSKVDILGALKFALENPTASPSPSPLPFPRKK